MSLMNNNNSIGVGNYKGVMLCNRPFAGSVGEKLNCFHRFFTLVTTPLHSLMFACIYLLILQPQQGKIHPQIKPPSRVELYLNQPVPMLV